MNWQQVVIPLITSIVSSVFVYLKSKSDFKNELLKLEKEFQNDIEKLKLSHKFELEKLKEQSNLSIKSKEQDNINEFAMKFLNKFIDNPSIDKLINESINQNL